jgi:hypothetical protein
MVVLLVYPPSIECILWLLVGIVHLGQGEHLVPKLYELTVHSPCDFFHCTISQVNEANWPLAIIHQLLPSFKLGMISMYHVIRENFHLHHGKSWFVGNNNLVSMVILMIGILQPIVIPQGIEP